MSDVTMQSGGDRGNVTVTCPRCGYDVSGAFPTWTESCPVVGLCTECGLEFLWRDLLNPDFTAAWWIFDARNRKGRWIRAFIVTSFMLLRPRRLWTRITMWNPPTLWRMAVFGLAWAAILYGSGFIAAFIHDGHSTWSINQNPRWYTRTLSWSELLQRAWANGWTWPARAPEIYKRPLYTFNFAMVLAVPLAFAMLTDSCRIARVRAVHIVRGGVLAAIPALIVTCVAHAIVMLLWLDHSFSWWWSLRFQYSLEGPFQFYSALFIAAYLGVFWWALIRRYLCMPTPRWVFFATFGVGTLASFTLAFWLWLLYGP